MHSSINVGCLLRSRHRKFYLEVRVAKIVAFTLETRFSTQFYIVRIFSIVVCIHIDYKWTK